MQRSDQKYGKICLKKVIIASVLIYFVLVSGLPMPLVARYVHSKIKLGMTANEVKNSLGILGRQRLYCKTVQNEKVSTIFDQDKCFANVLSLPNQQEIEGLKMTVTLMGPAFKILPFV